MAQVKQISVTLEIVNALSGNVFMHKLTMPEDYHNYDLESQDKLKQIRESFKKVTADRERIFYAKESYDIFNEQDVYKEAGEALTEKTKPILEAQKKKGKALADTAAAAAKKNAKKGE